MMVAASRAAQEAIVAVSLVSACTTSLVRVRVGGQGWRERQISRTRKSKNKNKTSNGLT